MKWIEPGLIRTPGEITNAFGNSILLGEQLAKRGIISLEKAQAYLDPRTYKQSSPYDFEDMSSAIERINQAILNNERDGVWGEFDVDGQTSTALLVDGLRQAGAQVDFHIPNRARESHGIRLEFLKKFMQKGIDLLITCDTGITDNEALEYAADQGMDVILTDHHTPPEKLPPALAIINPHMLPKNHPMRNLAGVGAAYQVIRALFKEKGQEEQANSYLDLVALGTVADLAELSDENRFYTQKGLQQMNQNPRPALEAILSTSSISSSTITESIIGFTIGPRLNAVGRMDDANNNVEFLLSKDSVFVKQTAAKLEDLNSERKIAVNMVYQAAREMLEREPELTQFSALVLAKAGWARGVVGIAASKLSEDFNKPVILMNIQDDIAAGSVRSVEGVDIIRCIRENTRFLNTFGGHPMAAGVSLNIDKLREFRASLSRTIDKYYQDIPSEKEIHIDGYLPFSNLNFDLVKEIESLAPFGSGNPPPVLVSRNLNKVKEIELGKNKEHRKLVLQNSEGESREALWWNANGKPLPSGQFDLAYYLRLNEYRGQRQVVLEWIDWQEHEPSIITLETPVFTQTIRDHRLSPQPLKNLDALAKEPDTCFWAEGLGNFGTLPSVNRTELKKSKTLAILTPPPSLSVLQNGLEKVMPEEVILFRLKTPDDSLEGFLNTLSGLVKYAISHYTGQMNNQKLAAALGQTRELIQLGLEWWTAHGDITLDKLDNGQYKVKKQTAGKNADQQQLQSLTKSIQNLLNENAAFRSYYTRADPAFLLRKIAGK